MRFGRESGVGKRVTISAKRGLTSIANDQANKQDETLSIRNFGKSLVEVD